MTRLCLVATEHVLLQDHGEQDCVRCSKFLTPIHLIESSQWSMNRAKVLLVAALILGKQIERFPRALCTLFQFTVKAGRRIQSAVPASAS